MTFEAKDLIYDWNRMNLSFFPSRPIGIHDESLRDGLQAPMINHPSLGQKLHLIRLMNNIGIDCANIGFPASSPIQSEMIRQIAIAKDREHMGINLMTAARTELNDVRAIVEVVQQSGTPIEAGVFIGSSRLRHFVESWDKQKMVKQSAEAVRFARSEGLDVMFVTEDTTRAYPEDVKDFYQAAIDAGARKLCVCDTVGFADEHGTTQLVEFIKNKVVGNQTIAGQPIEIEWHGHADRMMEMANTIAAIKAGATRVESTFLSVGERSGNTPTEGVLLNLYLMGWADLNLTDLITAANLYSEATGRLVDSSHPIIGNEAFSTGSGVHAAAIEKAVELGREDLAALIYCGFDPRIVGGKVRARIGQMSGRASVRVALADLGYEQVSPETVESILRFAKESSTSLTEQQLKSFVE